MVNPFANIGLLRLFKMRPLPSWIWSERI